MTKVLAFIPARGGSKGIPNKNMRPLAGVPLVGWTIAAARDARTVSRVVVSSDSEGILQYARDEGVEAVLRPSKIAGDDSPVEEAEEHALAQMALKDETPDVFVRLQPTSPLRNAYHVDRAVQMVLDGADSVVSVCHVREHPYLVCWLDGDGKLRRSEDGPWRSPRQQYPDRYFINGAIYAATITAYVREHFAGRSAVPYIMPRDESVDIDTLDDWHLAERRIAARGRV